RPERGSDDDGASGEPALPWGRLAEPTPSPPSPDVRSGRRRALPEPFLGEEQQGQDRAEGEAADVRPYGHAATRVHVLGQRGHAVEGLEDEPGPEHHERR